MAITKGELIQLLRGFADTDEVECITAEKPNVRREASDSFRNVSICGVCNKTKKWELLLSKPLAD